MKLRKKMLISYTILDIYNEYVAPRAGAWIETHALHTSVSVIASPLAQGRGLKPDRVTVYPLTLCRPSRRGVD